MADMAEVDQLDDSEAYFAARRIAWEDGYRAEGRTQGRVETLLRLTMRRFGTSTAEVVAVFLEGVDDAERLTKFGDWVVDCARWHRPDRTDRGAASVVSAEPDVCAGWFRAA